MHTLPQSTRNCNECGNEIPASRLQALPTAVNCRGCQEALGDVTKTKGFMSWSHKTAPELLLSTTVGEAAIEWLHANSRKRNSASLNLGSPKNSRIASSLRTVEGGAEFDYVRTEESLDASLERVTNGVPASCHPERPRVSATGHCLDCAVRYYQERL